MLNTLLISTVFLIHFELVMQESIKNQFENEKIKIINDFISSLSHE
jgi:hypothetical protein